MFSQVVAGTIVAAVVGLAGWSVSSGHLLDVVSMIRSTITREGSRVPKGFTRTHRRLLNSLLRDQSKWGRHRGQFGRFASLAESKDFNPTAENMSTKPQMYMTRWPCLVLRRHDLAPAAVERAVRAVRRLYVNGLITGDEDWAQVPGPRRQLENFRHTICGALILVEHGGWTQISSAVLGMMLDQGNQWQNADGGWAHTSPLPNPSDLYSTLYATQLLHLAGIYDDLPVAPAQIAPRLESSLDYLANHWRDSGWSLGSRSSEDIFPQAFIEVADILRSRRPELFADIATELRRQLNPVGGLAQNYLEHTDERVSQERHLVRLAYATSRAGELPSIWQGLMDAAMRGNIETLNAAEAAFLLDLASFSALRSPPPSPDPAEAMSRLGSDGPLSSTVSPFPIP